MNFDNRYFYICVVHIGININWFDFISFIDTVFNRCRFFARVIIRIGVSPYIQNIYNRYLCGFIVLQDSIWTS